MRTRTLGSKNNSKNLRPSYYNSCINLLQIIVGDIVITYLNKNPGVMQGLWLALLEPVSPIPLVSNSRRIFFPENPKPVILPIDRIPKALILWPSIIKKFYKERPPELGLTVRIRRLLAKIFHEQQILVLPYVFLTISLDQLPIGMVW